MSVELPTLAELVAAMDRAEAVYDDAERAALAAWDAYRAAIRERDAAHRVFADACAEYRISRIQAGTERGSTL